MSVHVLKNVKNKSTSCPQGVIGPEWQSQIIARSKWQFRHDSRNFRFHILQHLSFWKKPREQKPLLEGGGLGLWGNVFVGCVSPPIVFQSVRLGLHCHSSSIPPRVCCFASVCAPCRTWSIWFFRPAESLPAKIAVWDVEQCRPFIAHHFNGICANNIDMSAGHAWSSAYKHKWL